jgi:2-oxoglutarate ferredoxin oxidoreductase subunit alpha
MATGITIMVAGEAGQGVQSTGFILAKTFARGGYHVFADQDYESRVRGGHNFFRIRVCDEPVAAVSEGLDILLALNEESIRLHKDELLSGAAVICDGDQVNNTRRIEMLPVSLEALAEESGTKLMANTVAIGAAMQLLEYDLDALNEVLKERFAKKGAENVKAARAGADAAAESGFKFEKKLKPVDGPERLLLNGNEALCLGAIAAGCTFMAAYPMTPATPILEFLAAKADELGLVVVQVEDEIAAVNMPIGAAFTGARAMTATSGSGFCLMVEGLGMSGITETPLVIVNAQRPGPCVGLPTRTEQGDLLFVLHAHHGEFPRAVVAPSSVEDAFYVTARAFNNAEKYQLPVIILTDHYLATSFATVDNLDISKVKIDRGALLSEAEVARLKDYKRHQDTASGISPRALPMQGKALVITDADEHDARGHLTESADDRNEQMLKRLRKLEGLKKEIARPLFYGPLETAVSLVGWGSSLGALKEVVDTLNKEGEITANLMHLNELWPFPAVGVSHFLKSAERSLAVEGNATGQLAWLIRAETGQQVNGNVLKFDGRPLTPSIIIEAVKKEVG